MEQGPSTVSWLVPPLFHPPMILLAHTLAQVNTLTYVHTQTHIFTYTHTQTHDTYTHMHSHKLTHIHIYNTHTNSHTHTMHINKFTHTQSYMHSHILTFTYALTYSSTLIQLHINSSTHIAFVANCETSSNGSVQLCSYRSGTMTAAHSGLILGTEEAPINSREVLS